MISKNNYCKTCNINISYGADYCKKHRPFSENQRKKLSDARIGKKQSNETLSKLSKIRTGKTAWNKGIEMPRGEKANNWKGGKTREASVLRKRIESKLWRSNVFERDNYTCKVCNTTGGTLNAHHIELFSVNPSLRYDVNNGITLCQKCHRFFHRNNNLDFLLYGSVETFKKLL